MREDADLGNPWQGWFTAQGLKWKGGAFGEEELSMIERGADVAGGLWGLLWVLYIKMAANGE